MRYLFAFILLTSVLPGFAQSDDYPDFRKKNDFFIRVREKDVRSDLASFTTAGLDESMGKPTLKSIPMKEISGNFMAFEGDNIRVAIKTTPFLKDKHKLIFGDEEKTYLLKIDAKPYYGNYGKLPVNAIEYVSVIINKDTVAIPAIAYSDIYDPGFSYKDASGVQRTRNKVYISGDGRTIYVYVLSREGHGMEVTWVIQDKKFLRRVLDFGFL
jgi:hypothetical protein